MESSSLSVPKSRRGVVPFFRLYPLSRQRTEKTSAAVFANKFGLGKDAAFHGAFDVGLGGVSLEVQFRIERVQLEKIAVRLAGRRARSPVTDFAEIISALAGPTRKLLLLRDSLRKLSGIRGQVEEHPVHPRAHGSVRIVHDERQALRFCRHLIPV